MLPRHDSRLSHHHLSRHRRPGSQTLPECSFNKSNAPSIHLTHYRVMLDSQSSTGNSMHQKSLNLDQMCCLAYTNGARALPYLLSSFSLPPFYFPFAASTQRKVDVGSLICVPSSLTTIAWHFSRGTSLPRKSPTSSGRNCQKGRRSRSSAVGA